MVVEGVFQWKNSKDSNKALLIQKAKVGFFLWYWLIPCPSIRPKWFWTLPNCSGQVQNVLNMDQSAKFSIESHIWTCPNQFGPIKNSFGGIEWQMPCPSIDPKLFWTVQIVYVRSKSFCSGQNNFHQVQIRLFWTNFYDLDPTKMNWTHPKRLVINQIYLDGPNSVWT